MDAHFSQGPVARRLATIAALAGIASLAPEARAQAVVHGMGKPLSEYTTLYGKPLSSTDGATGGKEYVWEVKRKSLFGGQKFRLTTTFVAGSAMEEQWVRPGADLWTKDELWTVLDGKGARFRMLRRDQPLARPFDVLATPNTLLNFIPDQGGVAALLQNTLQGPMIRIASDRWAQSLVDLGVSGAGAGGNRATSQISGREPPRLSGRPLTTVLGKLPGAGAQNCGGKKTCERAYRVLRTPGKLVWKTRGSSAGEIELTLSDRQAVTEVESILRSKKAKGDYGLRTQLSNALAESFRNFYPLATNAVPDLLADQAWLRERVEGAFTEDVVQDLIAFGQLPSEFSLLEHEDASDRSAWSLVLTRDGYILRLKLPPGYAQ